MTNTVLVRIVRDYELKPYIGGFRNKTTDTIYHNAWYLLCTVCLRCVSSLERSDGNLCSTQTTVERKSKWDGRPPSFCRETQTVTTSTRSQQTTREGTTQMARPDLYLDTSGDTSLSPRPYVPAAVVLVCSVACWSVFCKHRMS